MKAVDILVSMDPDERFLIACPHCHNEIHLKLGGTDLDELSLIQVNDKE